MKNLSIQFMIATMELDHTRKEILKLLNKMNITSDVVIANQSNCNKIDDFNTGSFNTKLITTETKGLSYNRNLALLNSTADILVIADDDVIYNDDYEFSIKSIFNDPSVDVVLFSLKEDQPTHSTQVQKINHLNYRKYGSVRIAFRRKSVVNSAIFFPLQFGAGSIYTSGEDTLFLKQCIQKKLKVIKVQDVIIDELDDTRPSTWYSGNNSKFYFDKGALYYEINKSFFWLNSFYFAFRKTKESNSIQFKEALKLMYRGRNAYKNGKINYENSKCEENIHE